MAKQIDVEEKNTNLWDMWEKCKQYQSKIGLRKNIPMFVDFFEGRQWPAATERTKSLPRPVINIIKMIVRNKESAIQSSVVKLVYKAEDEMVNAEKFTNFADYIQKEMRQEEYDARAVHDGTVKGSYFYHYYWDSEAKGKVGNMQGGLRVELIHILNIGFANPKETDEQKQKWIIIATREEVNSIRAKADKDVDVESIVSDEDEDRTDTKEQDESNLVTVITRYFRKNGEVYCERATRTTVVNKPFPISPDIEAARESLGIDAPNNSLPDNKKTEPLPKGKATLYPVVVGNYEAREDSIYGLGEVEGLIPNQKAINFNLAMTLLSAQNNAWSKYVVTEDALKGQEITNEPGQVLTDYSKTGNGIRKLEGSSVNQTPIQIINTLTDLTRVVTGSTEVMTGEAISANMSGAAIAQLQSQAQQPIEVLRDNFWRVKEKQGRILEQFFKLFYENKDFTYSKTEQIPDADGNMEEKEVSYSDRFSGSEFADVNFSIVVEAVAGTKSSAAGDINMLDNLLSKGLIDKKTYIKAYPKNALNNRTEIMKAIEEEEKTQIAQLTQQLQEITLQLEQATEENKQNLALIQQQKEVVDKVVSVIKENNQLRSIIATLYAESKAKIEQGNMALEEMSRKQREAESDATEFAQALYAGGAGNDL